MYYTYQSNKSPLKKKAWLFVKILWQSEITRRGRSRYYHVGRIGFCDWGLLVKVLYG